jgi:hypothetical protein
MIHTTYKSFLESAVNMRQIDQANFAKLQEVYSQVKESVLAAFPDAIVKLNGPDAPFPLTFTISIEKEVRTDNTMEAKFIIEYSSIKEEFVGSEDIKTSRIDISKDHRKKDINALIEIAIYFFNNVSNWY